MTQNEAALLASLEGQPWRRPMDLGGSGHNGIAKTLRRMVAKGWVEDRARGAHMERGSYVYRIADKGRQALANHRLMVRL